MRASPIRSAFEIRSPLAAIALASFAVAQEPAQSPASIALAGRAYHAAEAQANVYTLGEQAAVSLARDPRGNAIVVWHSRVQEAKTSGIYARRFDARGRVLGGEVHVNRYEPRAQHDPCVAVDANGAAWFAWESERQDGSLGTIVARRFDAELRTARDEVIVNEQFDGHQSQVALACDSKGDAVVAWCGPTDDVHAKAIWFRRLGPDGKPLAASVCAANGRDARDEHPSIAIDSRGEFVVAWSRANSGGVPRSIMARAFDATGKPRGDEFEIVSDDASLPIDPVAAIGASGELVVGWMSWRGVDYAPTVRRFAPSADRRTWNGGAAHVFLSDRGGSTVAFDLSLAADGSYALLWNDFDGVDPRGDLWARIVDAHDVAGATFAATATRVGAQAIRSGGAAHRFDYDANGTLVIAWSGNAALGDASAACVGWWVPAELDPDALVTFAASRDLDHVACDDETDDEPVTGDEEE